MSLNAPFPYIIDEDVRRRNPTAVFKLSFAKSGQKYFIFKGLRIYHTVETLSKQIYRELGSPKDDSILYKAICYIRQAKITTMTVEVIKEIDDPVQLLMCEYEALQAAKDDPNCLNTRFVNNEYFPNWISQQAINDFNKAIRGIPPTNHDKNLRRFLNSCLENDELVEKVFQYVKKHYRAGSRSKKANESNKDIPKGRRN